MSLKVHQLLKPTQEIEDYLRKDIPFNGLPLYDLTLAWDACDWLIARSQLGLEGCLIVYKGDQGIFTFFTRGSKRAVLQLVTQMSYPSIFAIIPQNHKSIVEEHYHFLSEGKISLMSIEKSQFQLPKVHTAERLTSDNLEEVDNFYKTTTAGAWNPTQLNIGPFYAIREGIQIVSICGVIGVYSKRPGVAVIGNLATSPRYRGQGYGTSVLVAVINELFKTYRYVTLMVDTENHNAIRIYNRLGFNLHNILDIGVCQRREIGPRE